MSHLSFLLLRVCLIVGVLSSSTSATYLFHYQAVYGGAGGDLYGAYVTCDFQLTATFRTGASPTSANAVYLATAATGTLTFSRNAGGTYPISLTAPNSIASNDNLFAPYNATVQDNNGLAVLRTDGSGELYNFFAGELFGTGYAFVDSLGGGGSAFVSPNITLVGMSSSVLGDPQFTGLLGQSYQIHGIDGAVYNLISDPLIQVNSRFTYLSGGECLTNGATGQKLFSCWSHPGSYLTVIAIQTNAGGHVVITAGSARDGFLSVLVNEVPMKVGANTTLPIHDVTITAMALDHIDLRTVTVQHAGLFSLTIENSDNFLNIVRLQIDNTKRLVKEIQSHGLIGQTWLRARDGRQVKEVEGYVNDYLEEKDNLLGCSFMYNKFQC